MLVMTSPAQPPGERRLDRPPSDRYRPAVAPPGDVPTGSVARAFALGVAASISWLLLTVLLGGVVALSTGLIVLAAAAGRVIALAVAYGGTPTVAASTRQALALGLVVVGFAFGQLGLWAFARFEGGVLAPIEYLAETFGVVVPVQLLVAAAVAWWTAR